MDLMKEVQWTYGCGIELTYVPVELDHEMDASNSHSRWGMYSQCLHLWTLLRGADRWLHCGVGTDPGCVEAPTKVLRSWREAYRAWHEVSAAAAHLGLTPFHPEQQGGMGHVHIDIPDQHVSALYADLVFRPYLPWVFVNPRAVDFCASLGNAGSFHLWQQPRENWDLPADRYIVAHRVDHHIEWRAFEAAADWQEQEAQLAFLQRYFAYIVAGKGHKLTSPLDLSHAKQERDRYRHSFEACYLEFAALIEALELPWERYEYWIEVNLIPSFKDFRACFRS